MTARAYILLCLAAALLSACASAPRHTASAQPKRASEGKPYDFRAEGTIPPAAGSDAPVEADVEEIPVAQESLSVSDADAPPPDTTRAAAAADSSADGFRVQVFASSDREIAENAGRVATERFGLPAYTDLEAGMYKVRVGDYGTRKDAEAALATFRSHYYPDAWIVPARIRVPRAR